MQVEGSKESLELTHMSVEPNKLGHHRDDVAVHLHSVDVVDFLRDAACKERVSDPGTAVHVKGELRRGAGEKCREFTHT